VVAALLPVGFRGHCGVQPLTWLPLDTPLSPTSLGSVWTTDKDGIFLCLLASEDLSGPAIGPHD
jgi:hypothetical protein